MIECFTITEYKFYAEMKINSFKTIRSANFSTPWKNDDTDALSQNIRLFCLKFNFKVYTKRSFTSWN